MNRFALKDLLCRFHDKIDELIDDGECGSCDDEEIEMYEKNWSIC